MTPGPGGRGGAAPAVAAGGCGRGRGAGAFLTDHSVRGFRDQALPARGRGVIPTIHWEGPEGERNGEGEGKGEGAGPSCRELDTAMSVTEAAWRGGVLQRHPLQQQNTDSDSGRCGERMKGNSLYHCGQRGAVDDQWSLICLWRVNQSHCQTDETKRTV